MKKFLYLIAFVLVVFHHGIYGQCNPNVSSCTAGTSPSYTFANTAGPGVTYANPVGCNTGVGAPTNEFAFITLYITTSGNLNMLIDGSATTGYLDVVIYNVPAGQAPCTAVMNSANEIACNYASDASGCVQIGNTFPCLSDIPTVPVTAGQVLMVIVNNYSGASTSFNLSLSTSPGSAQSGPPNAAINSLSVSGLPPNTICSANAPVQLTAVNNGGAWSGVGVSASGIFNPATAGVGTHTINYSIGIAPCTATGTTTISVIQSPTLSVNSASICSSQSATLTANASPLGGTYAWNNGATLSSTNTAVTLANPAVTTVYTLTYTSTNSCIRTATSQVMVNATPVLNVTNNSQVCQGSAITFSTSSAASSYTWTGPSAFSQTTTTNTLSIPNSNPGMSGTYSIIASSVAGCTISATSSVNVVPTSSTAVTPIITVCQGQDVFLTASNVGIIPNSYNWSGPNTYTSSLQSPTLTSAIPSQSGIYTVTANFVSGATNCTTMNTTTVTVFALPTLTFTSNSIICQGNALNLDATQGIGSYTWTGPGGLNQTTTTGSLTIPNANTGLNGTYTVFAQTAQSCTAIATTTVGVIATSSVTVTPSISVCQGSSFFLTANTSAPVANSYSWIGPSGFISAVQNPSVINSVPNQSGIYTITANFTMGGTTCTRTNTTSVTVIPSATVPFAPMSTICNNGTIYLVAPSGGGSYDWKGPNGFISAIQNPTITNVSVANQGVYSLSITTSGCVNTGSLNVGVYDVLNFLNTPTNTIICLGKTSVLSTLGGTGGSGNYSYTWNPATNLSSATTATTIVTGSTTTVYTLTLADANCAVTLQSATTVTVNVNPKPFINFSTSNSRGCEPFCTDLMSNSVPASVNCTWKFSNNVTGIGCSSPNFCFDEAATYNATLTVTDINGCVDSLSQTAFIIVDPKPTPSFDIEPSNPTILINEVGFFDYSYIGAPMQSWHWDFGDPYVTEENDTSNLQNASHIYESVGIYTVSLAVTNMFGCKDTINRLVNIEDEFALFIPNAFTPSKSEGKNDTFFVQGRGFLEDTFEMTIFDRWGNVVFETTDIHKGWDGSGKSGAKLGLGIYVYKISVKDYKSKLREFFGHITLL